MFSFSKDKPLDYSLAEEPGGDSYYIRIESGQLSKLVFRVNKVSIVAEDRASISADLVSVPPKIQTKLDDNPDAIQPTIDSAISNIVHQIMTEKQ